MEKNKEKKQEPYTLKQYKKYRNIHYALKVAPFVTVAAPLGIEIGVNWNEWFAQQDKFSVAFGLCLAVITTILSVLAIAKKDSELMKKIGPFISLGIGFLMWGAVCWFLSNLLYQLAYLLITAGLSILSASIEDAVDKQMVKEKYETMKQLADDNGFTKKGKWKAEAQAQAEHDAKKYQEEVRFIPHD